MHQLPLCTTRNIYRWKVNEETLWKRKSIRHEHEQRPDGSQEVLKGNILRKQNRNPLTFELRTLVFPTTPSHPQWPHRAPKTTLSEQDPQAEKFVYNLHIYIVVPKVWFTTVWTITSHRLQRPKLVTLEWVHFGRCNTHIVVHVLLHWSQRVYTLCEGAEFQSPPWHRQERYIPPTTSLN